MRQRGSTHGFSLAPDERHRDLEAALRESAEDPAQSLLWVNLRLEGVLKRARKEADRILRPTDDSWQALVEAREVAPPLAVRAGQPVRQYLFQFVLAFAFLLPFALTVGPALLELVLQTRTIQLGVWDRVLMAAVMSVVALGLGRLRSQGSVSEERLDAAEKDYRRATRRCVNAWLRQLIAEESTNRYSFELDYGDASGLGEIDDRELEIATETQARVQRLIERMPGGAIGISGPRGVGKSTILRAICRADSREQRDRPLLAAVVDAPVEYEARDFVLHLFAEVCSQIVGRERVARLRGWDHDLSGRRLRRMLARMRVPIGAALLLGGLLVAGGTPSLDLRWESSRNYLGPLISLAGFLLVLDLPARMGRAAMGWLGLAEDPKTVKDVNTALLRLRQIWFQQSFSTGWSGSFKSPVGVEAEGKAATELSERQMSLPDIVELFRDFLRQVSASRDIRIGIDELDKMDDGGARRFLNEIKVVFRIPDCFFFISVSEDAMSSFERRGLPFRDVFDSSFDDVVLVPNLEYSVAKGLLEERITDLSMPFVCLLHCISGGLPRDLIRAARDLVELREERKRDDKTTDIRVAAEELIGGALRDKVAAARIASRSFESQDHVDALARWLDRFEETIDAETLLDLCAAVELDFWQQLRAVPLDDDLRAERREVERLAGQLAAFAYLSATLLELFVPMSDGGAVVELVRRDKGVPRVDRLARMTQGLAADVHTTWSRLSALRAEMGLREIRPPAPGFRGRGAVRTNGRGWFRTSDLSRVKRALSH